MADCSRTAADIKRSIRSCDYVDSKEVTEFYDRWAQMYEQVSVRTSSSSTSEGELRGSVCVLVPGTVGQLSQKVLFIFS